MPKRDTTFPDFVRLIESLSPTIAGASYKISPTGHRTEDRFVNNSFVILHFLGAVQGAFLAAVLLGRRRRSVANGILAVTMLAFSLDLAMGVYHAAGYDIVFPHLIGADFPLAFLYGPLLYLYARTLSRREQAIGRRDLLHLLPFALLVVLLIPFFLQDGVDKLAFVHDRVSNAWTRFLGMVNHFKLVHALIYVAAIFVLLKRHRRRIRDTFSSTERINLLWLRNLMIGIVGLTLFAVVLYVLSLRDGRPVIGLDPSTVYDDYMLLGLALLVYAIGLMGLRQPEIFDAGRHDRMVAERRSDQVAERRSDQVAERSFDQAAERTALTHAAASTATAGGPVSRHDGDRGPEVGPSERDNARDRPRYTKSGMDNEAAKRYEQDLLNLMQAEKLYRRGDLTLQDLADALRISPHNLTEVINTRIGLNFYDFINGYRVREAQERLLDPGNAHLTVLGIAMESGFNSKSAFNAIFKKHVKMTPSQFRSRQVARSSAA